MKKLLLIATTAIGFSMLQGCDKDKTEAVADYKKIYACAFVSDKSQKEALCSDLNSSEQRIVNCAQPGQNTSRKEACKTLNGSELQLVGWLDGDRPTGSTFNLQARKMGQ